MLRSYSRCLIVTLFSEQYDSIDLISSKVIISVFIAKVAGQRTCHNMHLFGCLQHTRACLYRKSCLMSKLLPQKNKSSDKQIVKSYNLLKVTAIFVVFQSICCYQCRMDGRAAR